MEKNTPEELLREREKIDALDKEIVRLLGERLQCSKRVAEIKLQHGLPVLNAGRETEILERIRRDNKFFGDGISVIYSSVFSVSRALQHKLFSGGEEIKKIASEARQDIVEKNSLLVCQGVEGAYSQFAAQKLLPGAATEFVRTWKDVFERVKESKEGVYGVLPVENSAAGSVTDVYDLILKYKFFIVKAAGVKVEHCLASAREDEEIKTVVSHPQAIHQCSEFIEAEKLSAKEFSNTAAAAKYIFEQRPKNTAAICSTAAAEKYGLKVLRRGIQNSSTNTTRFIMVSKRPVISENAGKISLCFSLPHRTGSLYSVLERFAVDGLNLTKIESRPIPGKNFEYNFFLDFTGNISQSATMELLCALSEELPEFYFLGNYPEEGVL